MIYQIKVKGELDQSWTDWLGSIRVIVDQQDGDSVISILTVDVIDQSNLFGILDRIRDLNIFLISVMKSDEWI